MSLALVSQHFFGLRAVEVPTGASPSSPPADRTHRTGIVAARRSLRTRHFSGPDMLMRHSTAVTARLPVHYFCMTFLCDNSFGVVVCGGGVGCNLSVRHAASAHGTCNRHFGSTVLSFYSRCPAL